MERINTICNQAIRTAFLALFILVPLILTPWNYELFEYNKMMVTYGLTIIILSSWVCKMIIEKRIRIAKTPLDIPIVAFVLSQFVATLFSIDTHVSWFGYYSRFNGGMISIICYVALYYAFVTNFLNEKPKEESHRPSPFLIRTLWVTLITGGLISLYGVAEHFGIDKNIWVQDVQTRVFSTLGQPNWLAAYLVVLIPITTHFAFQKTHAKFSFSLFLGGFLSFIFFLTLLYTRSRSGLLGLAFADGIYWAIVFLQKKRTHQSFRPQWKPFFILHIAIVLFIFFHGTYQEQIDRFITLKGWQQQIIKIYPKLSPTNASKKTTISEETKEVVPAGPALEVGGTESGTIRKYVWQAAIIAWRSTTKTFLIGTGTETFAFTFFQFRPVGHNLTSEWDFLYNKAHNEFLNYLATTGIFGLGSYLFFLITCALWFIKKSLFLKKEEPPSSLEIALFAGWCSLHITNFFGFSVVITQLFLFLIPAFLIVISSNKPLYWEKSLSATTKIQTIILSSLGIFSVILLFFLAVSWQADTLFASGYHLSKAGYIPQGYTKLTQAILLNPTEPLYHDERGTTLATLSFAAWNNKEASLSEQLASEAIHESNTATQISPNNVNFWKSRTKIMYSLSPIDEKFVPLAIEALEKARDLSPNDPKIAYNLAILYGRSGQIEKATESMKKAKELKMDYRDAYIGLTTLYSELKQPNLVQSVAAEYLEKVNPNDTEFQNMAR